ncbi:MAG: transporter substrate-binding domain-containing protein [Clostridiales Family XIII bacterium]|jgi:polar amino acid transport system substrate-binding protein|nr:transporter substrate-binding domain-containing protein [Clostridiales Family XIII bacterium]
MNKKSRMALVVLLALVMALVMALAGCGAGGEKKDDGNNANAAGENATPAAADTQATEPAGDGGSDLDYVKANGTMKIGITIFKPMNYWDKDGKTLIGFDTEFAQAVCEKLGVKAEFIEIDWDMKAVELKSKNIDCVWNGFTVREELKKEILFTDSYMKNMQVAVIRAADKDKYKTIEDIAGGSVVAEQGSAGEGAVIATDSALKGAAYTSVTKQTDALMEVKSGTADVAILDYTLAKSMVGEGTSYSDLLMAPGVELVPEEYAVGFRPGSDIAPELNKLMKELTEDGTLDEIAQKYELTASLLSNQAQ